jgi:CRISPR-associated protein Csx3
MNTTPKPQIQLEVTELRTLEGNFQTLAINLLKPGELIEPKVLAELELPSELDLSREVILFGQAPIWLYSYLVNHCHEAPWVGCYDARKKLAVVVQSRVSEKAAGDELLASPNPTLCPAIFIGGPPDSGKSVLSNALRLSLMQKLQRRVFLHRANWDGDGNWKHESSNRELVKKLALENENRLHEHPQVAELLPKYFKDQAQAVTNLRGLVDLVLVDVGGKVQPEKAPLVSSCTHYIIISKDCEEIAQWHNFCQPALKPLAVIHSVLEQREEILQTQPVLEMVAGSWQEGETFSVPEVLLQEVLRHWTVGAG